MTELLRNAWNGWLDFMGAGKLSALLFAALLISYYLKLGDRQKRELFRYGLVSALLCILPCSAALIMLYQTKFYDYEWIWSIVPLTAVSACVAVLFLEWFWKRERSAFRRGVIVVSVLAVILLCGRLGDAKWEVRDFAGQRNSVAEVLELLGKDNPAGAEEEICLWAPEEVILHARSLDSGLSLLYGRDLFQKHLNAFSYEVYSQEIRELYAWMVMVERYGTVIVPVEGDVASAVDGVEIEDRIDGLKCFQNAISLGANRILVPGNIKQEALDEIVSTFSLSVQPAGEYYLLTVPQKSE